MCKHCESKENNKEMQLMENLPIKDDYTDKLIEPDGISPQQYIRKQHGRYFLVTEYGDDNDGGVTSCEIFFCPICGRKFHP